MACEIISNFAPFSGMRGSERAPHFIFNKYHMIDKNVVKELVEQWLEDKEYFLVGIESAVMTKLLLKSITRMVFGLKIVSS